MRNLDYKFGRIGYNNPDPEVNKQKYEANNKLNYDFWREGHS